MKDERTPTEIIEAAEATLATARYGLSDYLLMTNPPARRLSGLRVAIVFGRAVTNVIEHLRNKVPDFDEWYKRRSAEMADDEMLRYFYRMRSPVIKSGEVGTITTSGSFTGDIGALFGSLGPKPAGAESSFILDHLGGSGWIFRAPDGTEEKHYVVLPEVPGFAVVTTWRDAPTVHRGASLNDRSAGAITTMYLDYMERFIIETAEHFSMRG